jgi:hypothetical protein
VSCGCRPRASAENGDGRSSLGETFTKEQFLALLRGKKPKPRCKKLRTAAKIVIQRTDVALWHLWTSLQCHGIASSARVRSLFLHVCLSCMVQSVSCAYPELDLGHAWHMSWYSERSSSPAQQVADASDNAPLQKVADDIQLPRVAGGWRKAIRKAYITHLSPFVHGALLSCLRQCCTSSCCQEALHQLPLCIALCCAPAAIFAAVQEKDLGLAQSTRQSPACPRVTQNPPTQSLARNRRRSQAGLRRLPAAYLTLMHQSWKVFWRCMSLLGAILTGTAFTDSSTVPFTGAM